MTAGLLGTKLILVEGLPGCGKSSMAQYICDQLWRNGHQSRWIYEEEEPHPVAPPGRISDFETTDAYSRSLLNRWRSFASEADQSDEITILEARFFQDVIFGFLRDDTERQTILDHVKDAGDICGPLRPVLIYFYQPDNATTMRRICDARGARMEQFYINRNQSDLYGRRHHLTGFDGLVRFWLDVRHVIDQLLIELAVPVLSVDISDQLWPNYQEQVGAFLSLPQRRNEALDAPAYLKTFEGVYAYRQKAPMRRVGGRKRPDQFLDREFRIRIAEGRLTMHNYGRLWPINRLLPKETDTFYLASWPFEMEFERDEDGIVRSATRTNPNGRWLVTSQIYPRVGDLENEQTCDS